MTGRTGRQKSVSEPVDKNWLLIFYTVPSKPVNARMKMWRKLAKAGAVQLKSAVYILPNNEEYYELCQWLVSEVALMKGEGAFVAVDRIETMKDADIIDLFNIQRTKDYKPLEKGLDDLERKISSVKKGTGLQGSKNLSDQLSRSVKEFQEIGKIDFFGSPKGDELRSRINSLDKEIRGLSGSGSGRIHEVVLRSAGDYQGRTWVTRRRPFVDRMASAWLIRKFIDRKAAFGFIEEQAVEEIDKKSVAFDIRGGEFTHIGDLCTFEVLVRAFGIKDRAVRKIASIVHELDIKDEKYASPGASGVEDILKGIRTTAGNDMKILEKGMEIFEMLYVTGP